MDPAQAWGGSHFGAGRRACFSPEVQALPEFPFSQVFGQGFVRGPHPIQTFTGGALVRGDTGQCSRVRRS